MFLPVGLRGWDKRLIVSDRAHLGGYSMSVIGDENALIISSTLSGGGSTELQAISEQRREGFLWKME